MYKQNASYLVKHSDLGAKNLNKVCLKIVQKVLKWPLQYVNFQKFSLEKYVKICCPMKTFFKRFFMPFLGLTYLFLVSIQPNSKFHSPTTKILWIPPFEICWVRPCVELFILKKDCFICTNYVVCYGVALHFELAVSVF